jgi:CRP-like cAMP-binding protein
MSTDQGLLAQLAPAQVPPARVYQALLRRPSAAGEEVHFLDCWEQMDGLERALSRGVLARVPPMALQQLMGSLQELPVKQGQVVFEQDRPADGYYIVKSGHAEVCRKGASGRSYRLSMKFPGDAFGEGALMLGAPRSAMVRMLSSGILMRVSNDDFARLIRPHLVAEVTLGEAETRIAQGARWLDLREDDIFVEGVLPGVLHVPISLLRLKRSTLQAQTSYVVYAADRATAELGCYLLAEFGLSACFLAAPPTVCPIRPRDSAAATTAGGDRNGAVRELELRERALEAEFARRMAENEARWQAERAALLAEAAERAALASAEIAHLKRRLAAATAGSKPGVGGQPSARRAANTAVA